MAQYLNNDLEYLAGDYFEFDDGADGFQVARSEAGGPSNPNKQKDDTSALEYRNGKDMQGIPWERLNYSRDQYREMRLKQYKNYEDLLRSHEGLDMECKQVETRSMFYDFCFNTRLVKSTIAHFQLRNLLCATSKHDVYMTQNYSLMHWSSLLQRGKEVLNVAGQVVPNQKVHGARPLSRVQISTMALKGNLLVAGGFQGELICKYVDQPGVAFCVNITDTVNSITNAVDAYQCSNGTIRVMAAKNDRVVRMFDAERCTFLATLPFRGQSIAHLCGHLDYYFSSAWHPDGNTLATGNQDITCWLWDVRNLSQSFAVLKGRIGAIRGLKFSSDGPLPGDVRGSRLCSRV